MTTAHFFFSAEFIECYVVATSVSSFAAADCAQLTDRRLFGGNRKIAAQRLYCDVGNLAVFPLCGALHVPPDSHREFDCILLFGHNLFSVSLAINLSRYSQFRLHRNRAPATFNCTSSPHLEK